MAAHGRVLVVGNFALSPLQRPYSFWTGELGLQYRLCISPDDLVVSTLLQPEPLRHGQIGMTVVVLRFDGWIRNKRPYQQEEVAAFHRSIDDICQAVHHHRSIAFDGCPLVFLECKPAPQCLACHETAQLLEEMSTKLQMHLRNYQLTSFVSWCQLDSLYPTAEAYWAQVSYEIARIPYQEAYYTAVATLIARHVFCWTHRNSFKVMVTDCDYTLWAGAVAECGPCAISVEGTHRELQMRLLKAQAAGRLICLASKNDEDDVMPVFEKKSGTMPITLQHIAAWKINWKPKSANLQELADALNLGLDSFIFIDDNPLEIHEVQQNLPTVLCIHFPVANEADGHSHAQQVLDHHWGLDVWPPISSPHSENAKGVTSATEEAAQRTAMYRQQFTRETVQVDSNLALWDFIQSLEVKVDLRPISPSDVPRIAELSQRANQFHSMTLRLTEVQLHDWLSATCHGGLCANVSDRFGDYGLVLAALWRSCPATEVLKCNVTVPAEVSGHDVTHDVSTSLVDSEEAKVTGEVMYVSNLMMSCRVFQRGLEGHAVQYIANVALSAGMDFVVIPYCPTAKNALVLQFLEALHKNCNATHVVHSAQGVMYYFSTGSLSNVNLKALWGDMMTGDGNTSATGSLNTTLVAEPTVTAQASSAHMLYERLNRIPHSLASVKDIMDAIHIQQGTRGPSQTSSTTLPHSIRTKEGATQLVKECAEHSLGIDLSDEALDTPLEELGMTSLHAIQFFVQLQTACESQGPVILPTSIIFFRPTISSIADAIHQLASKQMATDSPKPVSDGLSDLRSQLLRMVCKAISGDERPEVASSLSPSVSLSQLGLDEITTVTLREVLMAEFSIQLPSGWAFGFLTVDSIAEQIHHTSRPILADKRSTTLAKDPPAASKSNSTMFHLLESVTNPQSGLYHAREGNCTALKELMEQGWNPKQVKDKNGLNALAWAAGYGQLEAMALLLEAGVDVESCNKEGRTALMWACRNGHLEAVQLLLSKGANLKAITKKGVNCFHWAVWGAAIEVADWLLAQGMELEAENFAGCNAPIWAAASGSIPMCEWLLQRGANFQKMNHWGHGAINKAAWRGYLDLIKWLLDLPGLPDQLFLMDAAGKLSTDLAVLAGHQHVAEFLQQYMETHPQPIRPAPTIDTSKFRGDLKYAISM